MAILKWRHGGTHFNQYIKFDFFREILDPDFYGVVLILLDGYYSWQIKHDFFKFVTRFFCSKLDTHVTWSTFHPTERPTAYLV